MKEVLITMSTFATEKRGIPKCVYLHTETRGRVEIYVKFSVLIKSMIPRNLLI